jgi:broad specificity phosphatase PhoE
MRLILARHGQTDWNKQGRVQGRSDVELNERGRKQAEALAEALKYSGAGAIYASPLSRAQETAFTIARCHDVDVVLLEGLMEIDAGQTDGLTYEEMGSQHGEFLEKWVRDCTSVSPPGGCTLGEVQDNAWGAIQEILKRERNGEGTAIAVTHFFPILSIVCKAVGLELSDCRRIKLDLASISILDFTPANIVLASLNDTCHLRDQKR